MYYVIGGQYESHFYGVSKTLLGAKSLASRNKEHWDNFQGWTTPRIYEESCVTFVESRRRITAVDGARIPVPVGECIYYHNGKKWCKN